MPFSDKARQQRAAEARDRVYTDAKLATPKSYGKYLDVAQILDQAILTGGGAVTFEDIGKTVNWLQRAYRLRKAVRDVNDGFSSWDKLVFNVPRDEKRRPTSTTISIEFAPAGPKFEPYHPEYLEEARKPAPPMEDFSLD